MNKDKLKGYTINEFAAAAKTYDEPNNYSEVKEDYQCVVDTVGYEPFSRLLDCGCGTGNFIALMSINNPTAEYVGIDLVQEMIEVARLKGIPNARFMIGDSEHIDIDNAAFDVITCIHSFHHYPEPEAFFREAYRILKKGGRLVIRDNAAPNRFAYWWMNRVFLPIYNNRIAKAGDVHLYTKEEIERLAEKSGFLLDSFRIYDGRKMQCILRKE